VTHKPAMIASTTKNPRTARRILPALMLPGGNISAPAPTRPIGVETWAAVVMDNRRGTALVRRKFPHVAGRDARAGFGLRERGGGTDSGQPLAVTLMNTPISAILERKGATVYSISPQATIADAVEEMN